MVNRTPRTPDVHHMTAHEIRQMLDSRDISAVELTGSVLSRISAVDGEINAYLRTSSVEALAAADEADRRLRGSGPTPGPLTGVPVMIKDNMSTAGIETTAASKILSGYIPPFDAEVVTLLKEAGAVILGKGNLDEFAMGSSNEHSAFGAVKNPWNTERVPGGSSGGAAAAVAAGECAIALGSDTGGSIRQPAALCGVVGMKPTYGLVSRYGLIAFASSLDQIGPITRDVRDCANTLNVIASHDPKDSTSVKAPFDDFGAMLETGVQGMRLGVPREYLVEGIEPGVRQAFEAAIAQLESLGATVEETSLPLTDQALSVYYVIAPSEASANLARYDGIRYGKSASDGATALETSSRTRGELFGDEVKRRILIGTYALSAGYYDAYYKKAQQVRTLIRREFSEAFSRFDALVTPTSPSVAFELGAKMDDPLQMYLADICTIPVNIAGLPAISVPCGMSDGMPVGLQVIGPQFGDQTVLQVAHAYEQSTDWHRRHPPL
ncbi:MAG: Asp-tRNA(Asn)/Glu-tRNA(Gln) amidotransferase subunit GatA [Chloroflexi bacterium]|nr:Asp-tRNA(Asn)/Glu-tRNA(Gln) amidotransferase subunit GatA [Chloroflexota bacterium]MDA1298020.1 Asp-tRNA(Asn)/Glu-tRNA(Gln) amidotransferase subunit GatA [Chloroflexota bacterium]